MSDISQSTPVNDHPTLTHEAITVAIRERHVGLLRMQAVQAHDAGAYALAADLTRYADRFEAGS